MEVSERWRAFTQEKRRGKGVERKAARMKYKAARVRPKLEGLTSGTFNVRTAAVQGVNGIGHIDTLLRPCAILPFRMAFFYFVTTGCLFLQLLLLLFITFSVLVANPKKLLYTVANPAHGLLNREGKEKREQNKKSGSIAYVCVRVCFLPIHSGLQWTYQPGSHRKKATQDFPSTFFLRCLP